jgi:RimJ/RimL family protein N-acetyltransferase
MKIFQTKIEAIKKPALGVAFVFYALICIFIESPRPHAILPINGNPHTCPLISEGAFPREIKGKVITLKKLTMNDFPDYFKMFSVQARKMLSFPLDINDEKWTKSYFEYDLNREKNGEIIFYGIFDNVDKCFIGIIDIRAFWRYDPGQMGCWLNEKYYGGGRMNEAVQIACSTFCHVMNTKVVNAYVEPFNQRSFAALRKFGFEHIGFSYKKKNQPYYILEWYL